MFIYLLFIVLTFFVIYLMGLFFFMFYIKKTEKVTLLFSFLAGFILFSVFSNYYSVIFSINIKTLIPFILLIISLIFANYSKLIKNLSFLRDLNKIDYFVITLLICFISFFGANGIRNFDSTLYHVQSIKWISEFPVVPGLGNLHSRFAFNSMFFPVSSLFSLNLVATKDWLIFPLNAVLFFVYLIWQYFNIKNSFEEQDKAKVIFIVLMVFLPVIYLLKWASSPTPDFACAILGMIILQWILFENNSVNANRRIIIIGTIITAITFKLSFAPMLVLIPFFLLQKRWLVDIPKISFLGIFISIPFLIRNYFLSGYLFYPFSAIDVFNPDWKIPIELVKAEEESIKAWAIQPNNNPEEILKMSVFEWFPSWVMGMDHLMKLLLFVCILFLIFGITTFILRKNGPDIKWVFFLGVAFLFWFVQAPDPRFIYGIIFFTVAYFMYWFSRNLFLLFPKINFKLYILTFILGFLGLTGSIYFKMGLSYRENLSQFVFPSAFYKDFEKPVIKEYESPFRYFVPEKNGNCFNAPLPCATGVLEENIELRGTTLAAGFRVRK